MGWLNKFFGKEAAPQGSKAANNVSFVILRDAVTFKTEATNWIRSQSTPSGTLMWFVLPYEKNQCYQPCFGVLADPALFGKLDRAQSFKIALGPTDSPSTFQWEIVVADPDKPGKSFSLVTVPLPIDETSLAKLQFLSEQVRVHYLFYASKESSNFVWFEMRPEFNEQLHALHAVYLSLKNRPHEAGGVSDKGLAKNTQVGTLRLGEASIELADGTVIALADIVDVSAPRFLIRVDPNLSPGTIRTEQGSGAVVLIRYFPEGRGDRPVEKIVPMNNFDQANDIVKEIQRARKAYKAGTQQKQDRITVGECEKCRRPLHVKAHAVRSNMHLTCKCGHANTIHVPGAPLK